MNKDIEKKVERGRDAYRRRVLLLPEGKWLTTAEANTIMYPGNRHDGASSPMLVMENYGLLERRERDGGYQWRRAL